MLECAIHPITYRTPLKKSFYAHYIVDTKQSTSINFETLYC